MNVPQLISQNENFTMVETKIEDGKLLYERKWFHRGQSVFVEGRDFPKIPATISAIGTEVVSFVETMIAINNCFDCNFFFFFI